MRAIPRNQPVEDLEGRAAQFGVTPGVVDRGHRSTSSHGPTPATAVLVEGGTGPVHRYRRPPGAGYVGHHPQQVRVDLVGHVPAERIEAEPTHAEEPGRTTPP